MDLLSVYAVLTTVSTISFAYLWYRREEITKLAVKVYNAAKDRKVTEEEFQDVADSLGKVLFKDITEIKF